MFNRQDREIHEENLLAPYAMKSKDTKGRRVSEEEPVFRTVFQRDRDRIIHSSAFRRLEYKTQVFVNHEGDYYRTRLTHTLEVAQIARSTARALMLNEDLAEAIAFAHDIGHTPFGHAGEDVLNEIMSACGDKKGFEHNQNGLRVVDIMEQRYPDFDGLNLTYEVREGIMKHKTGFDNPMIDTSEFSLTDAALLEAQVVNISDEVAYDNHDLDDGMKSGLFTEKDLQKEVSLWQKVSYKIDEQYKDLDIVRKRLMSIRMLINLQVSDLIKTSFSNIKQHNINSIDDVKLKSHDLISFSKELIEMRAELKRFLYEKMYKHYRVVRMCTKARRFIEQLFYEYQKHPAQLAPERQIKIEKWGLERVICDYIAEMTDRCALDEYKKLFDPYASV